LPTAGFSAVGKEFFFKNCLPTAFGVAVGKGLTSLPTASHCRLAASSAVGKERKYCFFEMFFADCFQSCSRQRFDLFADCLPLQSAKTLSGFFLPSFADCKLDFFFAFVFYFLLNNISIYH
jgi:hypothetical protein